MKNNKTNRIHYAFKILFMCCCLSGAVAGMVVHCKGVFFKAAAEALGVSPTKYATYSIFGSLASVVSTPFITRLFNRKPLKKILLFYLFIFCLSDALMGCVTKMWQCYLIGMLQGVTSSFLTVYPIAYLIRNWFVKNRGIATGVATMFAGLFSSIMNMVLSSMIQTIGWRETYIINAILAFVISATPVVLFAVRKPEDIGLEPYGGIIHAVHKEKQRMRFNKSLVFGILPFIVMTISFYMSTGYNQHLSNYAQDLGYSATIGASLISVCMLGNTVSKLILGYLNDLLGVHKTSLLTTFSMALAFIILVLKPERLVFLYVAAIFLGQATAFIVVQIPLLLNERFSIQNEYEICLSAVMITGSLTGALNSLIVNYLYSSSGTYQLGHSLSCLMLILCSFVIIYLYIIKKRTKSII